MYSPLNTASLHAILGVLVLLFNLYAVFYCCVPFKCPVSPTSFGSWSAQEEIFETA